MDGAAPESGAGQDRQGAAGGDVPGGTGRTGRPAAAPRLRQGEDARAPGGQPDLGFSQWEQAARRGGAGCDRGPAVRWRGVGPRRPPRQRRNEMTRAETWLASMLVATVAAVGAGCGIDEDVHNAALKDRDAQKQKLAETQTALDKEKAQHKADVAVRDARLVVLTNKLEALGTDVSRLETERGTLGGELESAKK